MIAFLNRYSTYILAATIIISFLMHMRFVHTDLRGAHVWRQTQTQTNINNFAYEDLNILKPKRNNNAHTDRIYRMEFPLMQWSFALFYKLLGPHIAISRILSFIIGVFSIIGIFLFGKIVFNSKAMGLFAAWMLSFSPTFYYFTFNPMPDNLALCFSIWFLLYYFKYLMDKTTKTLFISGILLCLATLTKLPFIVYSIIAISSLFIRNERFSIKPAMIFLLMLTPAIIWYAYVIPSWEGNGVVGGVLNNDRSFADIWNTILVMLYSVLPESILNYGAVLFFISGLFFFFKNKLYKHQYSAPLILVLGGVFVYYIYEINLIGIVHDYYLFPFFPLLFLLTAFGCYKLITSAKKAFFVLSIIALLILPITAALRIDGRWYKDNSIGFNKVYYYQKDVLRNIIPKDSYCVVGNDDSYSILLYYLDRKGWSFADSRLNETDLKFYISKGAAYLLSDCMVEEKNGIKPLIGEKVYEQDNLKVYRLGNNDQ